ncbi:hypothetical protein [Flagellimonas sp.]|uniref:hypothetical protein n=1 Tax=Flagellimonas sp. TaxID=2058762 RepID=UPI003B5047FA
MSAAFSLTRIGQFVRRDIAILKGTFVTGLLVGIVLLFLFCLFNMARDKELALGEFFRIFGLIYVPLGILFTFALFREYNSSKANQLYLSLPVSISERLAAKWFTSTVIYTFVFSVLAVVTGTLAIIFGMVLFGANFNLMSIFSEHYWNVIRIYFLVQPIFLVGAISFSKNRIGKTLLALGILVLGFVLFNFLLFGIFNHNYGAFSGDSLTSVAFDKTAADFSVVGRWFYGLLLGPIMLVVAYFKMTEKEV